MSLSAEVTTPEAIFAKWNSHCQSEPEKWQGIEAKYLWIVEGEGGGSWTLDCKEKLGVRAGEEDFDFRVKLKSQDFIDLAHGKLKPQTAFFQGKLKIAGDMSLALRLNQVIDQLISKED